MRDGMLADIEGLPSLRDDKGGGGGGGENEEDDCDERGRRRGKRKEEKREVTGTEVAGGSGISPPFPSIRRRSTRSGSRMTSSPLLWEQDQNQVPRHRRSGPLYLHGVVRHNQPFS